MVVADEDREQTTAYGSVYSVANVITVLRLVLIPFFFIALLSSRPRADTVAFVLFALAASTDFLDGLIARRTGTVTAVGKAIDPLVDRLLIASGVVGLYLVDRLSLWVVVVLVARDAYLLYGAWVLERRHLRLPVTYLGKSATAVLLVAFSSLIWNWPWIRLPTLSLQWGDPAKGPFLGGYRPLGGHLVYLGVALSVATAVQYTVLARRALRQARV